MKCKDQENARLKPLTERGWGKDSIHRRFLVTRNLWKLQKCCREYGPSKRANLCYEDPLHFKNSICAL